PGRFEQPIELLASLAGSLGQLDLHVSRRRRTLQQIQILSQRLNRPRGRRIDSQWQRQERESLEGRAQKLLRRRLGSGLGLTLLGLGILRRARRLLASNSDDHGGKDRRAVATTLHHG